MPALTPTFLMDVESRMQTITEREYARLNSNLWWQRVAKVRPSQSRRELIMWLLSTAMIRDQGKGGNIAFDDIVSEYTEYENADSGAGLKLRRQQLEDTDGGGLELAAQWSADIGAYMSYWPQKQVTHLLKNGHTATLYSSYDKVAFFATNHPLNPFKAALGNYANLLTGAASGDYPGACPIDNGVTLDVAIHNLAKVMAYIASIKMPNGEDPRFLEPEMILAPPLLFPRAVQATSAKFIAQAASSGGGSADVEGLIKALGYATPVRCNELAGYESNTSYFVVCRQLSESQLGGVIYSDREPYSIAYYGPQTEAQLSRMQELEWHCHGRNKTSPGHPFLIFKVKAT